MTDINHEAVLLGSVVTKGYVLEAYYFWNSVYYRVMKTADSRGVRFLVVGDTLRPLANQFKVGSAEWYKILYLLERNKRTLLRQNVHKIGKTLIVKPIKYLGEQASAVARLSIDGAKEFWHICRNL